MTKLIVVDLLQEFIAQQTKMGGPFDTPDLFFAALKLFLQDENAKELIRNAWLGQMFELGSESLKQDGGTPAEEVFAKIRKRIDDAVALRVRRDCLNIKDDDQAIKLIITYIEGLHELSPTISFDAFSTHQGAQAAVERALQVLADIVRALTPATTAKLKPEHVKALQELSARLHDLGRPIPVEELWNAYTVVLIGIEESLTGKKPERSGWGHPIRRLVKLEDFTDAEMTQIENAQVPPGHGHLDQELTDWDKSKS